MPDFFPIARDLIAPRYTGTLTEEMLDCIREGRHHTDRPSYGHALAMEVLALEAWELAPPSGSPPNPHPHLMERRMAQVSEKTGERAGFTPGPWKVYRSDYGSRPGIEGRETSVIAYGTPVDAEGVLGNSPEEIEANARLIAAAPDLYASVVELREMLMAFVGAVGDITDCSADVDAITRAEAALARAEARS